ncbi:hypothetical protein [Aeromonas caviae]|uniref:Uncharacterized protein n=1 Tax=Aeromonas caviae TaxID=648 RepID=A0AAJ5ZDC2_AERCA|nr:hypothetical protein [Aeromonas caviae]RWT77782.1 hypothetical protein DN604_07385 [Aeromonas caviae]WFG00332.1 hypothetical protein P5S46_21455 [Aeromonas caviae]
MDNIAHNGQLINAALARKEELIQQRLQPTNARLGKAMSAWMASYSQLPHDELHAEGKTVLSTFTPSSLPPSISHAISTRKPSGPLRSRILTGFADEILSKISSDSFGVHADMLRELQHQVSSSHEAKLFHRIRIHNPDCALLQQVVMMAESGMTFDQMFRSQESVKLSPSEERELVMTLSIVATDFGDRLAKSLLLSGDPVKVLADRATLRSSIQQFTTAALANRENTAAVDTNQDVAKEIPSRHGPKM